MKTPQQILSTHSAAPLLRGPFGLVAQFGKGMAHKAMCVRSCGRPVQGGGSSRASSPANSCKSVVGHYDLDGVPTAWDNHPSIRARIRENKNLCVAFDHEENKTVSTYVNATVENLRINSVVLEPLAAIMKENSLQLPSIPKLIGAVEEFFRIAKLSRSSDECYQESWAIRRLIGKLKRFTYRPTPPQDSCVIPNLT